LSVSSDLCSITSFLPIASNLVLESLPSKILRTSQNISKTERHHLVAFLMDNELDAFAIPEALVSEVKRSLSLPHEMKSSVTPQYIIDEPSSAERLKQHFCEPIKVEEYESQKKDVKSHLLSLLESILTDENLSLTERKQRLKKFKKTYPEIYAQKFPSPALQKTRLIDRIRNFHL
ncbi:unnamed protein product, partial [Thelazia callipaeda]|uniref:SCHIP-1 domain-containing protein n=1 Tax=Thelazia callipaeda TaxID=103827 RepID=A0A158RCF9_THECL